MVATLKPRIATLDPRRAPPEKRADAFYLTPEWRQARAIAITLGGHRCAHCGATPRTLYVDHRVELKDGGDPLDQANLEPLCGSCHTGKTARARATRMREPASHAERASHSN